MKIGVYIGTFDPVHKGHKKVINHLLNKNYVEKVIIIPTGEYWNKKISTNIKDRINMLKFYENSQIKVCEKLSSLSYTYQILEKVKKLYNHDELYLIIGADNLTQLHLWKNVDAILKNKILVIPRNKQDIESNNKNIILVKDFKELDISSTYIRKNLNEKYLDKNVY